MKNWFTSLNGALALTALAWLSELWRAWLDMMFEYPGPIVQAKIDNACTLAVAIRLRSVSNDEEIMS